MCRCCRRSLQQRLGELGLSTAADVRMATKERLQVKGKPQMLMCDLPHNPGCIASLKQSSCCRAEGAG
jgi:hypothetical protein